MGVDMLGFRTIPGQDKYITPGKYQEMKGWFAGPKIVAEIYGIRDLQQLDQVMKDYQPDLLELSITEFQSDVSFPKPIILSLTHKEFFQYKDLLTERKDQLMYLMVPSETNVAFVTEISNEFAVLLKISDQFDIRLLNLSIQGVALEGSEEEKPGLKSYGVLADALELLEE
jgi:phosphoribosylanthranilate isomerase